MTNYYSDADRPRGVSREGAFQDHTREIVDELLGETMRTFGWWAYQTWWVVDGELIPEEWCVADHAPDAVAALRGIRSQHTATVGAEYSQPASVDVANVPMYSPNFAELRSAGVRNLVIIDVSGSEGFATRAVFVVPTRAALTDEVSHALLTAAFILPKVFKQERARAELHHRATHDSLTGLFNRRGLDQAVAAAVTAPVAVTRAVIYLDLDHFKTVNDVYGHDIGDELLIDVARNIAANVRPTDSVARLGGDEFVVVAHHVENLAEARIVALRIAESIDGVFDTSTGLRIDVRASLGVALWDAPDEFKDALRQADSLMYQAKQIGGGLAVQDSAGAVSFTETSDIVEAGAESALESPTTIDIRTVMDLSTGMKWGQLVTLETALRNPGAAELVAVLAARLEEQGMGAHSVTHVVLRFPPQFWLRESLMPEIITQLRVHIPTISLSVIIHCDIASGPVSEIARAIQHEHSVGIVLGNFGAGVNELSLVQTFSPLAISVSEIVMDSLSTTAPKLNSLKASIAVARALGILTLAIDTTGVQQERQLADMGCDLAVSGPQESR